jgi:hypothetical protein
VIWHICKAFSQNKFLSNISSSDFLQICLKKKEMQILQRTFREKDGPKPPYFEREEKMKLPYLDNHFQYIAKSYLKSLIFLMSFLTCSQIWLNPLVDDRQPTYLTKLKKETLFLSLVCAHTNNIRGMGSSIKCPFCCHALRHGICMGPNQHFSSKCKK